jgi:hypothetical protein
MRLLRNAGSLNDVTAVRHVSCRPVSEHMHRRLHSVLSFNNNPAVTCVAREYTTRLAHECTTPFTATGVLSIRTPFSRIPLFHSPAFFLITLNSLPTSTQPHPQLQFTMPTLQATTTVILAFAATLANGLPTAQPAKDLKIINGYFALW